MITVAKDGSGDFTSVQEAVNSVSKENTSPVTIFIKSGTYTECLTIDRPYITFEGEEVTSTILTFGNYAKMVMEDGSNRGTFRSYSTLIDTHDFTAKNITFENSAGPGKLVGQALAAYVDGDRIYFENCHFLGDQDTLFTGPLPPTVLQKNGFVGPKEFAPRINGRHLYRNCFICGGVDFIFGSSTAYFDHCEIYSNRHEGADGIQGYTTAASTAEGQEYGYVFADCKFTSDCPPESVYLGRPWRNFAKTVLINCELGEHICKAGWHNWNKPEAESTTFYAEYESKGPGAAPESRVPWSHQLTGTEALHFTMDKVLGDWKPLN
ncbi:MAG: pectin methylesterase [Lachnospiraceae bacterium]|nr:pectin methylesterase [Lachnospiraceae bacterium]